MKQIRNYLVLIALVTVLMPNYVGATGTKPKSDKKFLVSQISDNSRDVYFKYDHRNRLVSTRDYTKGEQKAYILDSVIYNSDDQIVYRIQEFKSNNAIQNYTQSTSYTYIGDNIIIDKTYDSDNIGSSKDTIIVNDLGQIISDRYYKYGYDINKNGNHIIEQVQTDVEGEDLVDEKRKRFEYDNSLSPFIHSNLPAWFIVSQLNLFEYVGENNPRSIIHETVAKHDGEIRIVSYDIENMNIITNADGYPIKIEGEDDIDGRWVTEFKYIELK